MYTLGIQYIYIYCIYIRNAAYHIDNTVYMLYVYVGDTVYICGVNIRNTAYHIDNTVYVLRVYIGDVLSFPGGSAGKKSACNAGDLGSVLGLGRSVEKGKATHSSILAWRIPWTVYIVYGVAKSRTRGFQFHFFTFICWGYGVYILHTYCCCC